MMILPRRYKYITKGTLHQNTDYKLKPTAELICTNLSLSLASFSHPLLKMVPKWSAICPATRELHGKAWACGSCLAQHPRASTSSPEVNSASEPAVSEAEGVTEAERVTYVVSHFEPEAIDLVSDSELEVIDLVSDSELEVIDLVSDSELEVADTPEPEVVDTPEPEVIDLGSEGE